MCRLHAHTTIPTNLIGSEFEVHGGRSILSGVSGLPYYCAPCVCVPAVIKVLAVWQSYIKKNKKNGRVSGVAAVQTNKQTNKQTSLGVKVLSESGEGYLTELENSGFYNES